jgi:hypothetical protein
MNTPFVNDVRQFYSITVEAMRAAQSLGKVMKLNQAENNAQALFCKAEVRAPGQIVKLLPEA